MLETVKEIRVAFFEPLRPLRRFGEPCFRGSHIFAQEHLNSKPNRTRHTISDCDSPAIKTKPMRRSRLGVDDLCFDDRLEVSFTSTGWLVRKFGRQSV